MKKESKPRNRKSSPEAAMINRRGAQAAAYDRVPEDFTYDDLEAWKYAHMSHGQLLDLVNEKKENE